MGDANVAFIILACVQGASTLALVIVTAMYVRATAKISDAAQCQADATLYMAREVHEQKLPRQASRGLSFP